MKGVKYVTRPIRNVPRKFTFNVVMACPCRTTLRRMCTLATERILRRVPNVPLLICDMVMVWTRVGLNRLIQRIQPTKLSFIPSQSPRPVRMSPRSAVHCCVVTPIDMHNSKRKVHLTMHRHPRSQQKKTASLLASRQSCSSC